MVCSSVFWLFVLEVNRTFWRGSEWKGSCVWGLSGVWILTNTAGLLKKKFFRPVHVWFASKAAAKVFTTLMSTEVFSEIALALWCIWSGDPSLVFRLWLFTLWKAPLYLGLFIYANNSEVKKCYKYKQHADISMFPCFAISSASQEGNTSQIFTISLQGCQVMLFK